MSDAKQDLVDASLLSSSHLTPIDHKSHPLSSWPSIKPNPIGRLSLLNPSITVAAARECIQVGKSFPIDWPVYQSGTCLFERPCGQHEIKRRGYGDDEKQQTDENGTPWVVCYDEILTINTQASSQWDYFLHFSYPGSGVFYGGIKDQDILNRKTGDFCVAALAKAGGIQTRGILIDIPLYLEQNNLPSNPPLLNPASNPVDLPLLLRAVEHFHLQPRPGDVLLVRTGFEDVYREDSEKAQVDRHRESAIQGRWYGVEGKEEVVKWIWETGFVAVGSDNPTFESWPVWENAVWMHPTLLSGMGIPIGEILRLNEVASECHRQNRWSFYFSSVPLQIENGIASPPNAVAIF
ncbi:hypothetical protein L198_02707 [Cryptococcus wingfieldii CBS 7118]|uniref:Cyclase n=1 Tax=Cryptococcus wingfieldii CBS 7118 TaxID=1295528 RepID=A0A1E3JMU2_9TREE|nr:hypothetical protein L198_02707 [Cryptococcus wingfieldii CBS 7118]ODO01976.1 hypothetical protein L198_02707 [Cryptococcus wingfieldii CBS 7118]